MSDTIVRVENLSKQYRIGAREGYKTFRETLVDAAKAPFQQISSLLNPKSKTRNPKHETIWALKDVSFEVKQGEVLGIIGRNGAGKSTLLKVLSKITEPTKGKVELKGRVGSLLEVGTGFHPELTGHENIYLYGAILGMDRWEVTRKFDEIVAFAELEKFLDTPVKRYSSGMYMRLAFAVSAHLEPEILLVDEVLAVGDAQFQKKCLGKMDDVSKRGRTILFVSHQMAAIQNLCQRAILLSHGEVAGNNDAETIVREYLNDARTESHVQLSERLDRKGTGKIRFVTVELQNEHRETVNTFRSGENAILKFFYKNHSHQDLRNLHLAVAIDNHMGTRLTVLSSDVRKQVFQSVPSQVNCIEIHIDRLPLMPGRYGLTIFCTTSGEIADWIQNAGFFDVEQGDYYGTGKLLPEGHGNILFDHHFEIQEIGSQSR